MDEFKELKTIIVDLPIYGSFSFCLFDDAINTSLSKNAKKQFTELFLTKKVDIKCTECNKEYPFNILYNIKKYSYGRTIYSYQNLLGDWKPCEIDHVDFINGKIHVPEEDEGIISYVFVCNMDSHHYQTMDLLYHLKNNVFEIRKIGQKPLNIDLKESFSGEYKKVLKQYDSFDDYRQYEQSESRGLFAGACTYLRRIFEKMVNYKIKNSQASKEEIIAAKKFDQKILLAKDQFDEDVRDILNNSYSLLSKGIHELNDEEIKKFHGLILEVINVQLESEKSKQQRDEKIKRIRSEINSEVSKHNEK